MEMVRMNGCCFFMSAKKVQFMYECLKKERFMSG